jgi:hypothetical protein
MANNHNKREKKWSNFDKILKQPFDEALQRRAHKQITKKKVILLLHRFFKFRFIN